MRLPGAFLVCCLCFEYSACSNDAGLDARQPRSRFPIVAPDGSGDYTTIQDAIDAVTNGDTIYLADGVFTGAGNRDLELRGGVRVVRSLSGDPNRSIIDCDGTRQEPHRGLRIRTGQRNEVTIEGITITHAYAFGGGAAALCEQGSTLKMRNVILRDNWKVAITYMAGYGSLENCSFVDNIDGGLSCWSGADVTLIGCEFRGNYVDGSGAAISSTSSFVSLSDCSFSENNATFAGGALFSDKAVAEDSSRVIAERCRFEHNIGAYHGGAARCDQTEVKFVKCVFTRNATGGHGGALWCYFRSRTTFQGCTFFANSATNGSAVSFGPGSSSLISNTVVAFNIGGEAVHCDTLALPLDLDITCSDVFGNIGGDWIGCLRDLRAGTGNLSLDPLFCDASGGDLRIRAESPCAPSGTCELMGALPVDCGDD